MFSPKENRSYTSGIPTLWSSEAPYHCLHRCCTLHLAPPGETQGMGHQHHPPPQYSSMEAQEGHPETWRALGAAFLLYRFRGQDTKSEPKITFGEKHLQFFQEQNPHHLSNIWLSLGPFTKLSLRSKVHLLGMFANSNESVYRNAYYISMYLNLICKIMYLNISLVLLMAQYFVNMWDV